MIPLQEVMYHVVATMLYLAAGLCFIIHLNSENNRRYVTNYGPKTAAAVSRVSRHECQVIWMDLAIFKTTRL